MASGVKKKPFSDYEDWSDITRAGGAKLDKSSDVIIATVKGVEVGQWDKGAKKGYLVISGDSPTNDNIDKVYGKPRQYVGVTQTTAQAAAFIEALAAQGTLKVSLVQADVKMSQKQSARRANPAPAKDTSLFADDIRTRLAKFKNSKLESVSDVKAFLEKVAEGTLKKVKFNDQTFSTDASSYSEGTIAGLIKGKPATLRFSSADPGRYNTLDIKVKLVDGVLTVI